MFGLKSKKQKETAETFPFPGKRAALDGNTAVIMCERESSDAAGAYPITPSTQMGEYWAEESAKGHRNISGRPLIFIEPEGEHAAAAVTAGLSMTGLRSANFSSGQGIAYMHESLYAAVGKRLTYVLNVGARAMTKSTLNVHAGHDDYHCIDDTGFFQLFGKNAQSVCDLNIIAHRIAELALNPGIVAQDGFLTTHLIESMLLPERALIEKYLGRPDDLIETPTSAQRILFGDQRRRIPELWSVDHPLMAGIVQNQDAYMQSVAAQRPFFFDHIEELTDQAMREFYLLTGRSYDRVMTYGCKDADYLILGQGSMIPSAQVVADYLRETRGIKVGVVDLVMFRPFPGAMLGNILRGRKGVTVLERLDQPLAVDLPIVREVRAALGKCIANGSHPDQPLHAGYPAYEPADMPLVYSGSFGMGSRDLQPEGLIAAVENMIDGGARKAFFYLSIDFIHDKPLTPKQEVHQNEIAAAYPHVRDLALHGSENPNLMPKDSITVRFHSIGGLGAITTGKNLAMTLFDLLGYHIKANPKYGSEKKGQPTTYYLSAAPEPIRINCEYYFVDVVLSPDPNVFGHTNALAGLKKGGVFLIQSDRDTPEQVWADIPARYRRLIVDQEIRVFYLDAFKIASEEATDADLQKRMQGIAFQGAFFAATPVAANKGLDEAKLLASIRDQLESKFGHKGARVVEDNVRVVRRGYDEVHEIIEKPLDVDKLADDGAYHAPALPALLKCQPQGDNGDAADIFRFWEQTGNFYIGGKGNDNLADPFIGMSTIPAATGVFRDMSGIRFEHPEWDPDKCTACGACYTVCPDTAIPGLVSELRQVLQTAMKRCQDRGSEMGLAKRNLLKLERAWRTELKDLEQRGATLDVLPTAIQATVDAHSGPEAEKQKLKGEFKTLQEALDPCAFSVTRPFFTVPEKQEADSGGLLSITVNPYTCKGCAECVAVCNDDALKMVPQTKESLKDLRRNWDFWMDLPSTHKRYIRIDNLEEGVGTLETLLLNKWAYMAFTSGDGACLGCSEKTVIHLFTATVEALMQPRVEKHVAYLDELIGRLSRYIQERLLGSIDVSDTKAMGQVLEQSANGDLTLASIAAGMDRAHGSQPVDQVWLRRVTDVLARLKHLRGRYDRNASGRPRASMGILNSTGCSSVWGSTWPFNPYPFPWANHLFQDAPSMAMGVFEGHMAKMADGFKAIRHAELELAGEYKGQASESDLAYFTWQNFTQEEYELCPPVVAVGGDGAMYDIGFQNLSRLMMSGKPIKVVVLDTQVYSNTGGQACTSGFPGQVSDMAAYGKVGKGKMERRKEIGLIAMGHRTAYVAQSTIAHPSHMIQSFIEGLKSRRPALFNLYTSCQPEHGIADDMGHEQARIAVESRAYPLFSYDPDRGDSYEAALSLEGNPELTADWPEFTLDYREGKFNKKLDLPMTFADFAVTEGRFRKHFRSVPRDAWNDNMMALAEFLDLDNSDREGKFPYIWAVDGRKALRRVLVSESIVEACDDRLHFWRTLCDMAGVGKQVEQQDQSAIEARVRQEVVGKIAQGLMAMAGGEGGIDLSSLTQTAAPAVTASDSEAKAGADQAQEPWIETQECTACDECIKINKNMFAYNADHKVEIIDAQAGPYSDLVKAAERCTAQVIHPGLPSDMSEPDIEKWMARAAKYND
jgi:pyruvate-ferredoxin/flavodoxin oxidoreductase